jgi:DNA-binding response OmpR family regulator
LGGIGDTRLMPATEQNRNDRDGLSRSGRRRPGILVVDDDPAIRELLQQHLSAAGYDVALADDAIAAGRMFLASTPDLLLIDISMPYMSGLEFVATVFADNTVPVIPVVFITAHAHFARHAEELGAECLIKPVAASRLLETVARNLEKSRAVADPAKLRPSALSSL